MKEEEEEWKSRGAKGSCILLLYPSLLSFLVPLLESASRISGRPVGRALRPFNPNGRLYRPSGLHRPRVFMTRTEDRHRKHIPCAFSNHLKKKYLVKFIDFAKKRKFAWKNEIQFHLARAHTHTLKDGICWICWECWREDERALRSFMRVLTSLKCWTGRARLIARGENVCWLQGGWRRRGGTFHWSAFTCLVKHRTVPCSSVGRRYADDRLWSNQFRPAATVQKEKRKKKIFSCGLVFHSPFRL